MKLIVLLAALGLVACERKRFDGCEVWQLTTESEEQVHQLHKFYQLHDNDNDNTVTFWEEPARVGEKTEVLLCKRGIRELHLFLKSSNIPAKPVNTNLQKHLDDLWARSEARHKTSSFAYVDTDFNTFDDIMSQLSVLQSECPTGVVCTVEDIGQTIEGRPIKIFRITKSGSNRRVIWLDALTHCREWLSGTTLMGILTKFIREYGSDADVQRLVDTYDWHIVPVVNADGYSYTWTDSRFWRKNRSPNSGSSCIGTDLNRNYEFMWGTPGASALPCSDTYRGASAASELETQTIQNAGNALGSRILLYITYHTYAELYLYPYGGVQEANPNRCLDSPWAQVLQQAGQAAITAVQNTYNEAIWETGATCAILYEASGSSQDWAHQFVKYSYTPELRGPGFDADASNILPSLNENWNGLLAMINEIEIIEGL